MSIFVERFFLQFIINEVIINLFSILILFQIILIFIFFHKFLKEVENIKSIQKWIPIENILEKGIIKIGKNKYIKILKINPINFNLKTQLEKEAILNSYKIFLKTCSFDMQILIQSKKED